MNNKSIIELYKEKEIHIQTREHIMDVKKRVMEAYQKQLAETVKAKGR